MLTSSHCKLYIYSFGDVFYTCLCAFLCCTLVHIKEDVVLVSFFFRCYQTNQWPHTSFAYLSGNWSKRGWAPPEVPKLIQNTYICDYLSHESGIGFFVYTLLSHTPKGNKIGYYYTLCGGSSKWKVQRSKMLLMPAHLFRPHEKQICNCSTLTLKPL